MTYTQQLRELLNELKLAKGKNCLIFAISERPARLKELIESNGFDVREISLKGKANLLEMLLMWDETTENTIYVVHGIGNQFPWVLPYINLHRDLFFDIKRPVVVVGSEYEIMEIQKHAPDWFRFRSRTYELKEVELGEEKTITRFAEPAKPKPVYYPLPVFEEEECEEEVKERIKIDEYLLSSERDDYKLAELYMSLSLSHFKLRDFERGEKYLQKSTAIRAKLKDNKGILLNYARLSSIFVGLGELEKVIEVCTEALKIDPNSVHAYIYRGNAYALFNLHEMAIEDYGKAIELNPTYAVTYYNRGATYVNLKQYDRAIEDYGEAIELNPNFAEAYNNRGTTYVILKQYDRAIEDYEKAIELNLDDAEAYNNRGAAYALLNQHELEIADYNKAIALNPNFAAVYRNRGMAYSKFGRYKESTRDFKKAGILFFGSGQFDDSVKAFSSCFNLRPKIENEDVIYSGLARFLITLNPDVIIELRQLRIEDEPLRKIFELTLMKLQDEDISEEIAMLEEKEQIGEKKILFELLKRL
jgi:tetratricopeptide (TPR) repeat protein